MYHPSMWHPIDMAAAFRSIRPTSASPTTSPEKASSAANGAFSVNTLLNQSSADHLRFSSTHPSLTVAAAAAAAAHQHHLFSTLFQHYPYAAAFRPLLNGGTPGLLTSSTGSKTSPSSSSSSTSSESSAFVPAGKKFKANSHDENHCETSSSDESFGKYPDHRCRSSAVDLQNPQCPICQVSFNGQEIITHVQQELDTVERRQPHRYRHGQKILQDNHNLDQTFKTRYETYLRVRNSRQQRLNAKLQLHNRRSARHDTRHCPICYQPIPLNTDDEYFFTHVQQCARKREQLAAVTAIANHHRLPAPAATTVANEDPDVNVVDMDEGIEREEKSTSGTASCQESFNSDQRYSPSIQTEISYLKSPHVPELDPPKCVVCMDLCVKPCVSLTCWHINCEDCWKKYLNKKQACPQCHLPTSSNHLRRIFLNKISK